jgi:hypothetical protein
MLSEYEAQKNIVAGFMQYKHTVNLDICKLFPNRISVNFDKYADAIVKHRQLRINELSKLFISLLRANTGLIAYSAA